MWCLKFILYMNDSLVAIVIDDLLVWNFCVIQYAQQCTLKNGTKIKKTRFVHHQGNQSKSRKITLKVHNSEPKKGEKKGSILFRRVLKTWSPFGFPQIWEWPGNDLGMIWEYVGNKLGAGPNLGMTWEWPGRDLGMTWEWSGGDVETMLGLCEGNHGEPRGDDG